MEFVGQLNQEFKRQSTYLLFAKEKTQIYMSTKTFFKGSLV